MCECVSKLKKISFYQESSIYYEKYKAIDDETLLN